MEQSSEKKNQRNASQEQQLNKSADALDNVTPIQRQNESVDSDTESTQEEKTDNVEDSENEQNEETNEQNESVDEDDEAYHATRGDQIDPDTLKDGFGKEEYAKTLGNKDYYKDKDKELHEELDKAKKESQEEFRELTPAERKRFDRDRERKKKKEAREKRAQMGAVGGAMQAGAGPNGPKPPNNITNRQVTSVKKQKSKFDKLKDKKKVFDAKKNIVKNKMAAGKSKIYEIMHPIQAIKNTIKSLGKKGLKALGKLYVKLLKVAPLPVLIATAVVIILLPVTLLIIGMTADVSGGGSTNNINKYDYTQVKVRRLYYSSDSETLDLADAALGSAYVHFFINNRIYSKGYSDAQLESMFAVYLLYAKTHILRSPGSPSNYYDVDRYETMKAEDRYIVFTNTGINDYPTYCDPEYGCNPIVGYFFDCLSDKDDDTDDDTDDDKDEPNCRYKGLLYESEEDESQKEETPEHHAAEILINVASSLDEYIAAPYNKNDVLVRVDNSFDVDRLDVSMLNKIIDHFTDNPSCAKKTFESNENEIIDGNQTQKIDTVYLTDQLSIIQSGSSDDDVCKPKSLSVKPYNVNDYILEDGETAYHDIGLWYPIGSMEIGEDGKYSGEPASVSLTSPFGYRINDDGKQVYHSGIDLATGGVDDKVPVLAVGDGTVIVQTCTPYTGSCGWNQTSTKFGGGGCQISIDHGNGIVSKYLHLSEQSYNQYVTLNQEVKKGDIIGRVGSTGCSTGPHLHFEIRENGVAINPLNYVNASNARSGSGGSNEG